VRYFSCQNDQLIKGGKTETGEQHHRHQQSDSSHRSFGPNPAYEGRLPGIK
jgi:hypothetical protein